MTKTRPVYVGMEELWLDGVRTRAACARIPTMAGPVITALPTSVLTSFLRRYGDDKFKQHTFRCDFDLEAPENAEDLNVYKLRFLRANPTDESGFFEVVHPAMLNTISICMQTLRNVLGGKYTYEDFWVTVTIEELKNEEAQTESPAHPESGSETGAVPAGQSIQGPA